MLVRVVGVGQSAGVAGVGGGLRGAEGRVDGPS